MNSVPLYFENASRISSLSRFFIECTTTAELPELPSAGATSAHLGLDCVSTRPGIRIFNTAHGESIGRADIDRMSITGDNLRRKAGRADLMRAPPLCTTALTIKNPFRCSSNNQTRIFAGGYAGS